MAALAYHNMTLLGKVVWHLCSNSNKLWVQVFEHKYLQGCSFLNAPQRHNASVVWKGILQAWNQLRADFTFRMGAGESSVWYSDWLGHGKIWEQLPFIHILDTTMCLRDLVVHNQWELGRVTTKLLKVMVAWFASVTPKLEPNTVDEWMCDGNEFVKYIVREGYSWLRAQNPPPGIVQNWSWVWKLLILEKVRMFVWLCPYDAIPVNSNRFKCNLVVSKACSRCSSPREDNIHSLRDCPHSHELWGKLGAWSWSNFWTLDLSDWTLFHARSGHSPRFLVGL